MNTEIAKKGLKAHLKNKTYKMSKKTEEKLVKQIFKCVKCKKNKTQTCDVKKYIEFSGANPGKCENHWFGHFILFGCNKIKCKIYNENSLC